MELSDDVLADHWEALTLGGSGVSHLDHVRVAWVLVGRHGAAEAEERLVVGTRRSCEHFGCPQKFDEALTRRWARAVARTWAPGESFDAFLERRPNLRNGRAFGVPGMPTLDLEARSRARAEFFAAAEPKGLSRLVDCLARRLEDVAALISRFRSRAR